MTKNYEPAGEYPPLPEIGKGMLYVMSPAHVGEVMTLEAARAYVDADRAMRAQPGAGAV